jgi:predicted alpha/beta hydrolase
LDPDNNKRQFWKWDWDTAGMFDLPAVIDFVKQQTGQEKIFYLGHSMGCSEFLVAAAEIDGFQVPKTIILC